MFRPEKIDDEINNKPLLYEGDGFKQFGFYNHEGLPFYLNGQKMTDKDGLPWIRFYFSRDPRKETAYDHMPKGYILSRGRTPYGPFNIKRDRRIKTEVEEERERILAERGVEIEKRKRNRTVTPENDPTFWDV